MAKRPVKALQQPKEQRQVLPRTAGQAEYCRVMDAHDITFCVGPAGSGKTMLAVAAAVDALKAGRVAKLFLVRPAVEAGEKIGHLPGSPDDKLAPYMRPIFDALHETLGKAATDKAIVDGVVEICPLGFMRGRTLKHSFTIMDESQNMTREQMKMMLTRLGVGSKMVVTGDLSQNDLPRGTVSGLADAIERLTGIPGVGFCALTGEDIQRHAVVKLIVEAYGRAA